MFPLTVGPVSAVSCSIEIVKKITLLRPTVSKGGDIKWKGVRIFLGVRARALVYEAFLFIPPLSSTLITTLKTTPLWFVSAIVSTLKKERKRCWMRARTLRVIFFCAVVTKWRGGGDKSIL